MPTITPTQIIQYIAYLVLLIIAGTLEYFKLLPVNSTASVFLLVVGHFFGNIPTSNALARNIQAQATATENTSQAPQGPLHVVLHTQPDQPIIPLARTPEPEPEPIILPEPVSRSVPQVSFPVDYSDIHFGDTGIVPTVPQQGT